MYPWSLPLSIRFVTIASVTISRQRAASTRCAWAWAWRERQIKTHRSKAEGGANQLQVGGDQCGLALSAHSAAIARTNRADNLVYTRSLAELCPHFKRVIEKRVGYLVRCAGYTDLSRRRESRGSRSGDMSGHSKWSTIKRQKGAADAKRGQLFTKLAREITIAARQGLPDPDSNTRLRLAVDRAKTANMPKDNIERAIQRAAGSGSGDQYEEVFYEGYGPGGGALMIQVQTDNRNRTVGEVRAVLTRAGGTLGENGSVGWMFDQTGVIEVPIGSADPDEIALVAIDAGASDVETEDGVLIVYTDPTDLHRTREALISAGHAVEAAQLTMRPKALVAPEPDAAVKLIRLVEKLEDLDDVQEVFTNVDIDDEVLAAAM